MPKSSEEKEVQKDERLLNTVREVTKTTIYAQYVDASKEKISRDHISPIRQRSDILKATRSSQVGGGHINVTSGSQHGRSLQSNETVE